ncbi:MAG: hypothetical protein H6671_01550 [Anaerolineaceae bacterium]|nr:hypothetical protein [Anaerolineaceae bacterium]
MMMALAATFHPRGEVGRLRRLYPQLMALYDHIIISMPPVAKPDDVEQVKTLPGVVAFVNDEWPQGRYMALRVAAETDADYVQYADLDRLLRWIETRPDELRRTVARIQQCQYLVIGRTARAWATHPQAMFQTERIINRVFSLLLGQEMDFGAGSKGLSRAALDYLVAHAARDRALGADTEWSVLLYRAGFPVESVLVDGLDWELPDQHQERAADTERQRAMIAAYDADADRWAHRVNVAVEIVEAGLDAWARVLEKG